MASSRMPFGRNTLALLATLIAAGCLAGPAQAATFTVNSTVDDIDASPGDGICAGGRTGQCTLRAAVEETNGLNGIAPSHTINVPAGMYTLSNGVLPVTWPLNLVGAGARSTIIDQSGSDRVFKISAGTSVDTNISGVTISGGTADAFNDYFGGNIDAQSSKLTITNSTITGGSGSSGGGISNRYGTLIVRNSTLFGNAADTGGGDGGAILNVGNSDQSAALTIENSTLSGNSARLAGGIISRGNAGNSVTIRDSTIAGNASTDRLDLPNGGGMSILDGTATVTRSIVANNTSPPAAATPNCASGSPSGTIASGGNNLESGTDCGFKSVGDRQSSNPQLGPLANNGGQTDTRAISLTSPALDAYAGCVAIDQRGVSRPQGPACDIGAFELVDTTPPDTTITSGPSGTTADTTFTFNSSEAGSTFECRVDTAAFAPCSSPFTTAALSQGPHTFEVRAIDRAGNIDPTPAALSFTVDTAVPDTTISAGPSGPTNITTPSFTFSSSKAGSTFECRVDTAAFAPCSSPFTTAALSQGPHTFEVRAIDALGNVDPTPASRTFTIDLTSPDTAITSGPPVVTRDRTPTFTFNSNEGGTTFECSLDGGPFSPCSSPFVTKRALRAGRHTFQARARDAAGNVDATSATVVFVIPAQLSDLPPPKLGQTFNVEPVGDGEVFVSESAGASGARARASATVPGLKGRNFIPLREARQIRVGSFLDTRRGRVRLLSARDEKGAIQSGEFFSGVFQTLQSRKKRAKGLTELRLKGSTFSRCGSRGKKANAARSRRKIRRLGGNAKGRFRTRGRYSAATVRGTIWTVSDRCDGTLTKVTRGKVAVRDFRRRKNILVRTGKSYLARARR